MKGQIRRGDVRTITAALMLVDLRGFTLMWDMMAPNAVIETLNCFDCAMLPVNRYCGEVMEIMGDGILAIFNESVEGGPGAACRQALRRQRRESMRPRAGINPGPTAHPISPRPSRCIMARSPMAIPAWAIGSISRSSAVTSISRLCRELDQQLIMSGEFVARLQEPSFEIGHFALRGAPRMQLLFALPPARDLGSSLI